MLGRIIDIVDICCNRDLAISAQHGCIDACSLLYICVDDLFWARSRFGICKAKPTCERDLLLNTFRTSRRTQHRCFNQMVSHMDLIH